jgi:hypothetical protein
MHRSLIAALALLLVASPASAASRKKKKAEVKACLDSYVQAQTLRNEGKLHEARDQLQICSRRVCPGAVVKDCVGWLADVERDQPTVVVAAHDERGHDLVDVSVSVDGAPLTEKLDGRPIDLDPGTHVFKFEWEDKPPIEERIVLRVGEKDRRVTADFKPPGGPPVEPAPAVVTEAPTRWRGVPLGAVVVGGVGIAALGAWATFGIIGLSYENHDATTCAPNCLTSKVDAIRIDYAIADTGMVVGIVGVVVSVVWTILNRGPAAPRVTPVAGLGGALVVGSF